MEQTRENDVELLEARLIPQRGPGARFGALWVDPRNSGLDSSLAAADSVASAVLRIDSYAHDGLTPREKVLELDQVVDAVALAQAGLETVFSQPIPSELEAAARAVVTDLDLVLSRLAVPNLSVFEMPLWANLVNAARHLDGVAARMRRAERVPLEATEWVSLLTFEPSDSPNGEQVAHLLVDLVKRGADVAQAEVGLTHAYGPVVTVRAPRTAAA